MLIRRKVSLVDLGDISRPGLEVLLRFVLDVTVLVVSAILPGEPTKPADVAGEFEQTCRLNFAPKQSLAGEQVT